MGVYWMGGLNRRKGPRSRAGVPIAVVSGCLLSGTAPSYTLRGTTLVPGTHTRGRRRKPRGTTWKAGFLVLLGDGQGAGPRSIHLVAIMDPTLASPGQQIRKRGIAWQLRGLAGGAICRAPATSLGSN